MNPISQIFVSVPPGLWQALVVTLRLAVVTTIVLMIVALPLAHWLNVARFRGKLILETIVSLPIVLPPTVIGFYLLVFLSPQHLVGSWWLNITGTTLTFNFTGLVVGSALYSLPFAFQPFQAALKAVPIESLEAAATAGASPWRVFWRIRIPLASRGISAGLILVFAHTIGEFGVVLMLGGSIPGKTKVASVALYDEVQKLDYAAANSYALCLLGISFVLLLGVACLRGESR